MRTRISTVTQLKQLFVEAVMNYTTAVTKISDGSVLNGYSFGIAKLIQKVQKDVALLESRIFPSTAFGTYLDNVGYEYGVSARFGATASSTYVLLVGTVGTVYVAGTNNFTGYSNVTFQLVNNVTIPTEGFIYALVRSTSTGSNTNVDPLTINTVSPVPTGHTYVVNPYMAIGGGDFETDDAYRLRIRDMPNLIATDTVGKLTQIFININPKVMRLFYYGISSLGQTQIGVLTQDGTPLDSTELNALTVQAAQYLCMSDLQPFGSNQYGISVMNISWQYLDFDFRADIDPSYNTDTVRTNMQIATTAYLNFQTLNSGDVVEWATMLGIIQSIAGVKYVPNNYFTPNTDLMVGQVQLPRVRGFIMRDINGNIISNGTGTLQPVYFPNSPNNAFITTALITA